MSISYRYQGTASTAHRGMVETNELKKVNFKRTYGQISNVTVCKNFSTIYLCLQTNPSTSTGKRKKKGVSRVPWNQTLITEWVSLPGFRFVWLRNDRSMSHIWPSMVWVPQFKLLRGCWSELPFGCKSLMVLNCWLLLPWHVRNWLTTTSTSWWELFLWLLIWTLLFGCKSLMNHDSNQLVECCWINLPKMQKFWPNPSVQHAAPVLRALCHQHGRRIGPKALSPFQVPGSAGS